jgi:hypothetical protein
MKLDSWLVSLPRYLRLQIPEVGGMIVSSSDCRQDTQAQMPRPQTADDVINVLGDQSGKEFTIFREAGDDDYVKTVAVGKFVIGHIMNGNAV